MVDCGRDKVFRKQNVSRKPIGEGRVEEEMPHVGGSRHIPKRDACAKMKINQSINQSSLLKRQTTGGEEANVFEARETTCPQSGSITQRAAPASAMGRREQRLTVDETM